VFDSDSELLDHVRGHVGVKREGDLPQDTLEQELQRAKRELNNEIRERLNNQQSLNIYEIEAKQKALKYFVQIRAKSVVTQNQGARAGPDKNGPNLGRDPKTVSSIRRHDYGDQDMNYWRDRMVAHVNKITE